MQTVPRGGFPAQHILLHSAEIHSIETVLAPAKAEREGPLFPHEDPLPVSSQWLDCALVSGTLGACVAPFSSPPSSHPGVSPPPFYLPNNHANLVPFFALARGSSYF